MSLSELYKALSDETRLRIVHILSKGACNVQELTAIIGDISQPTVSHHLKVLQSAHLVKSRREGTWIYYTLSAPHESPLPIKIIQPFLSSTEDEALADLRTVLQHDAKSVAELVESRRARSQRFFETIAPRWREIRANAATPRAVDDSYLKKTVSLIPSHSILLDVGCGTGALLEQILPRSGTTIAVDSSPAMLAEAKRSLASQAPTVDFRIGSLEHLPVADKSIDTAVVCMVLHHAPDPQQALTDLSRVIRPGGTLLIADLTPHQEERLREQYSHLWLGFDPVEITRWLTTHTSNGVRFSERGCTYFGDAKEVFVQEFVALAECC
jgi:ubiquinone/menaquinone biosynthesis C-methylase UbiE